MGFAKHYDYFSAPFVCFFAVIVAFQNQTKPKGMVKLLLFLFAIATLTSYHYLFYSNLNGNILQYVCYPSTAFLSSYAMYCYVSCNEISFFKIVQPLFIVFFCVAVYRYVRSEALLSMAGLAGIQNNYFYFVLMPLPILFIKPQSVVNYICLATCIFICVVSLKRSAIIAICLISFAFVVYQVLFESITKKLFLVLIAFVFGFYVVANDYFMQSFERSVKRIEHIESDRGSGRGDIIKRYFEDDVYDVTTFPEIFIGNGFQSFSNKYAGRLAATHNDLLEVLYSYGFWGLFLYLFFIFRMFYMCFVLLKRKNTLFLSAVTCLILFIVYGLFADVFCFFFFSMPLFLMVGILEASERRIVL